MDLLLIKRICFLCVHLRNEGFLQAAAVGWTPMLAAHSKGKQSELDFIGLISLLASILWAWYRRILPKSLPSMSYFTPPVPFYHGAKSIQTALVSNAWQDGISPWTFGEATRCQGWRISTVEMMLSCAAPSMPFCSSNPDATSFSAF